MQPIVSPGEDLDDESEPGVDLIFDGLEETAGRRAGLTPTAPAWSVRSSRYGLMGFPSDVKGRTSTEN